MRLRKTRRTFGCEINIAPLIDVVFLLIIFFMTVAQISKVEVEAIEVPPVEGGGEDQKPVTVMINVLEDGQIIISGKTHTLESVGALLAKMAGEVDPAKVTVLLRGDRKLPWRTAGAILAACASQGVGNVNVAVRSPEALGADP